MRTSKYSFLLFTLLLPVIWAGSCSPQGEVPPVEVPPVEEPPAEEPPAEEPSAIIYFKDLEIEEAQELVMGRWRVFRVCGGIIGCEDITRLQYHEFVNADTFRISGEIDSPVYERRIGQWEKVEGGIKIVFENAHTWDILLLTTLVQNDTLYHVSEEVPSTSSISYTAVREIDFTFHSSGSEFQLLH
jgi:hypothetical protein